jgi:hypothetical protein
MAPYRRGLNFLLLLADEIPYLPSTCYANCAQEHFSRIESVFAQVE